MERPVDDGLGEASPGWCPVCGGTLRATEEGSAKQDVSHAPEWTRTTTGKTPHKALNLARLPIPPRAQRGEYIPGRQGRCSRRGRALCGTCIRPRAALECEHVFVSCHSQSQRGDAKTWI